MRVERGEGITDDERVALRVFGVEIWGSRPEHAAAASRKHLSHTVIVEGADLPPRIETATTDSRVGDALSWAPLISTNGLETSDSAEVSAAASDVQT